MDHGVEEFVPKGCLFMSGVNWEEVGARIAYLIQEAGMKQKDLAEIVGRSEQVLSNIIRGRRPCPMEVMIKICDHFDIPFDWLIGRGKKEDPKDTPTDIHNLIEHGDLFYKNRRLSPEEKKLILETLDFFLKQKKRVAH